MKIYHLSYSKGKINVSTFDIVEESELSYVIMENESTIKEWIYFDEMGTIINDGFEQLSIWITEERGLAKANDKLIKYAISLHELNIQGYRIAINGEEICLNDLELLKDKQ